MLGTLTAFGQRIDVPKLCDLKQDKFELCFEG